MIFQHTLKQVLDGSKTQTRRPALPLSDGTGIFDCDMIGYPLGVKSAQRLKAGQDHWRTLWQVGKDYAVCPGRGKPQVARIRILKLWHEDVRTISEADARAEGWEDSPLAMKYGRDPIHWYLRLWASMHDGLADVRMGQLKPEYWCGYLSARPQQHWLAWALQFELVKGDDDGQTG